MKAAKLVNPFKPTAGAEPPVLIGRDRVIEDFSDGLDEGVGSPARLMRITGPRGSGKTVLLTELGDMARKRGWTVLYETAGEGLCENIVRALSAPGLKRELSAELNAVVAKAHVGVERDARETTLREALGDAAAKLTGKDKGLLVTIDEVQDADEEDIRVIASAVQHLIRERKNIAFVFAGITTGVLDLINGKSLTFLRRAKAEELGAIPIDEVACALRTTVEKSGLAIDEDALTLAAHETAGYAYLIQLVGYHIWRTGKAHAEQSPVISLEDAKRGVSAALADFETSVLETALSDLPRHAMEYLLAMSEDDGPSSTAAIADRLGLKGTSLTSYRRMLIKRQVIEPTARGYVDFSIPHMRDYLRRSGEDLLVRYGG